MSRNKLYLSSTNMQVFLNCKRKYKYKYIDRMNTKVKIQSKYLSFGSSIHMALAQFNRITDKQYRTIDNLHMLLRKNWRREGYVSLDEEREYGMKALAMLSNYFNNPQEQGQKNMIIEEMIKKDMEDKFILCGKLDKVYLRNDGLIETVDYKTGNTIEPLNKLQMPIYILLTKEKLGRYPDIISLYYMARNKKIEQKVTDEFVNDVLGCLWDLYEMISNEREFPCNPTKNCINMCEYYEMCNEAKDHNFIIINMLKRLKEEEIDTVF